MTDRASNIRPVNRAAGRFGTGPEGFTSVTVTGQYLINDDPATGTVTFTLTQSVSNGGVTLPAVPLVVTLDDEGSLTASLAATDDDGTVPTGVWYGVTEQIQGGQPRDYFILVSAADSPTVDLATLMPAKTPWW